MRSAHRARQRARRTRQHHGGRGAVRRRGAAVLRRRATGGRGPPGLPVDRHRDQHRAGAHLQRQPATDAEQGEGSAQADEDVGPRRHRRRRRPRLVPHPESVKAQFTFLSGARAGQVEAFRKGYIGLGRHPLSDVRFDAERDLDVSSRHAAIVRKTDGFVLQDLGSRNGTFRTACRRRVKSSVPRRWLPGKAPGSASRPRSRARRRSCVARRRS
ncbi:MAG: hypothetical protein DMD48_00480 [Gemmatimonadetes bacterium]|nr:MAG: hypothetical protein DMD48_00480 [Gemmatimonadota bacterium]